MVHSGQYIVKWAGRAIIPAQISDDHNFDRRQTVEKRARIEAVISKFFEALNNDDASDVPLTEEVEYYGMFSPVPVKGASDVRDYLEQIAPFMLNEKHGRMIVEGDSVAVTGEFDSVNGLHNEGAFFFEIRDSKIDEVRVIFDTRRMFEGKKD